MIERLTFTQEFKEANDLDEITYITPEELIKWEHKLAAYEDLGTVEELAELVKAHEDGRAPILPCKVGDTVYRVFDVGDWIDTCEHNCKACSIDCPEYKNEYIEKVVVEEHEIEDMKDLISLIPHFGKTAFPGPEEAQAALKEGNDDRF